MFCAFSCALRSLTNSRSTSFSACVLRSSSTASSAGSELLAPIGVVGRLFSLSCCSSTSSACTLLCSFSIWIEIRIGPVCEYRERGESVGNSDVLYQKKRHPNTCTKIQPLSVHLLLGRAFRAIALADQLSEFPVEASHVRRDARTRHGRCQTSGLGAATKGGWPSPLTPCLDRPAL